MEADFQPFLQQGIGGQAISLIIIDGYNVLGILHGDMEKARTGFIDLLIQYKKIRGHEITLVFDGYKNGPGREQALTRGGVRILYSGLGERADDLIKRTISATRKEWIVVSSDRDIVRHAWAVSSIPVPSEIFLDTINRRILDCDTGREAVEDEEAFPSRDDDDLYHDRPSGGNPHRTSRKDRALKKALSKL
ncbi:MAG: NYN domain-containing protein [Thermodesulfovibrionales bacterium]|jgi:hypothetical protein